MTNMVVVIDYGVGNPGSILNMLKKLGADAKLSCDRDDIQRADRLILPGVGSFDRGLAELRSRGLEELLTEEVTVRRRPILGICLGMQMFARSSEEGQAPGLGWLDAVTQRLHPQPNLRLPHMGWNWIRPIGGEHSLFRGLNQPRFYFVHSYHVVCRDADDVLATCRYGDEFVCAVRRGNIFGTQFHPEKSHRLGLQVLKNFLEQ
jgi:glutamine amidotransferase